MTTTLILDFQIELVRSTTDIMMALIEKGRVKEWTPAGGMDAKQIKADAKAIADALREAVGVEL